jgi:transcriptional regulator with XRE-family HTH domain
MATLGERLQACRQELGLKQGQLAAKAGLKNQSIIGMLETGGRRQSAHLPAIAAALGVNVLWLQYEKGPKYPPGSVAMSEQTTSGEAHGAADSSQGDEITIPEAPPDPEPEQELYPGLYLAERRTMSRPQLTVAEQQVLDGYRLAPEDVKIDIRGRCLVIIEEHKLKGDAREKQA